jgi:hypothetical protein
MVIVLIKAGGWSSSANIVVVDTTKTAAQVTSAGELQAQPGQLIQINTQTVTTHNLRTLRFVTTTTTTTTTTTPGADLAGASIQPGQVVTLPSIEAAAGLAGRLLIGEAAKLTGALKIAAGAALTLALASASASAAAQSSATTMATLTSLDLSGLLNIVGDGSTVFVFPPSLSDITTTTTTTTSGASVAGVQVSGGLNLQGACGVVPITITGASVATPATGASEAPAASNSSAPAAAAAVQQDVATVASSTTFWSHGPLLGRSARMIVKGALHLAGALVEPTLELQAGSYASVAAQDQSGLATYLGNVTFNFIDETVKNIATLIVNGTAADFGNNVFFEAIQNCPAQAKIRINIAPGSVGAAAA